MARPRKPVALREGNLTKEEIRKKELQEERLRLPNGDLLEAPKFLDDVARKEFLRVSKGLIKLNVVDDLDLAVLAIYSDAFSKYIQMTKKIEVYGPIDEYTNSAGATNKQISVYVNIQLKYIDVIFRASSKLGLTVSDRLNLIIPEPDESDDPLIKVLSG